MRNKLTSLLLLALVVLSGTSCKKYLDINSDPDTTQEPSNSSVFPVMLANMPYGVQRDAIYVAKYIQNWNASANGNADTYDRHGYSFSGGTMGNTWYMTYYAMGKNLNYIIENGIKKQQWDCVGAALALKAWSFQHTTDYNSDIIFHDAFKEEQVKFRYEGQDTIYAGVDSLCRLALNYLDQAANLQVKTLSLGDYSYNGDITKWKKFTYGLLARNWHHLTNKATYNADSVLKYLDNSFTSGNDDFLVPFDGTKNDNSNYFGTFRDNLGSARQSNFITKLLDGTILAGTQSFINRDPRISHMLSASQDTTNGNGGYRGVDPGIGDPNSAVTTGANARKRVAVLWGDSLYANPSGAIFNDNTGKYLFKNRVVMPVMTYAELCFIRAEAYLRRKSGADKQKAYDAYLTGINAHFDFINRSYATYRGSLPLYNTSTITTAQRNLYLAGANVKQNAAALTLGDVMLQKYIALWGWGFYETWVDLRRYHYNVDTDPFSASGTDPVYKGFQMPSQYASTNNNKPVYRVRPHFTSEYNYNRDELIRIGALTTDYHTKEMWFSLP